MSDQQDFQKWMERQGAPEPDAYFQEMAESLENQLQVLGLLESPDPEDLPHPGEKLYPGVVGRISGLRWIGFDLGFEIPEPPELPEIPPLVPPELELEPIQIEGPSAQDLERLQWFLSALSAETLEYLSRLALEGLEIPAQPQTAAETPDQPPPAGRQPVATASDADTAGPQSPKPSR